MILKIFKAVWFLSLLVMLAIFFYVYASLPERIVVHEGATAVALSRDGLFYLTIAVLACSNVMVFVVARLYATSSEPFLSWFYGLIISVNLFVTVALNFINLYNSAENFDYPRIGFIIYGSVTLVVAWALSWPVYALIRKILTKQVI
jgi:hypothetical protein